MPKCTSCGAKIIWIRTKAGKHMPCNPELVEYWLEKDGPNKIVTRNGEVVSCAFEQMTLIEPTGTGYISHWDTCPSADKHRLERRTS